MPALETVTPKTTDDRRHPPCSLTFFVNKRRHAFVSLRAVTLVHEQIRRAAAENHLAIAAYCFMPDHLHLLLSALDDRADCARFVARAKQYAGIAYARAYGGRRLWERRIFRRQLLDDEEAGAVAARMLASPVRAGLVARIEDYPFVGSTPRPRRGGAAPVAG